MKRLLASVLLALAAAPAAAAAPAPLDTSAAFKQVTIGEGFVDASERQVVRTAAGRVYVFAADDKSKPSVARAWKGNRAGIPTAFAEVDAAHHPVASADGAITSIDARLDRHGIVHVVYHDDYYKGYLQYRTFSTATDRWGPVEDVADAVGPHLRGQAPAALALDPRDRPSVLYTTDSSVVLRTRVGGRWTAPFTVATGPSPLHPQLVYDAAGNLHVAWLANALAAPAIEYRRRSASGVWGPVEQVAAKDVLTNGNLDQGGPSLVVTRSGVPYVLWLAIASLPSPGAPLPFSAVRVSYRAAAGRWLDDSPKAQVYTHAPTLYASGDDLYVFLGHDSRIRWAYLYRLKGKPWSRTIELSSRDSTDGSASARWDPQRDPDARVIDTLYFDEDVRDDKSFVPELFYMAVLPGSRAP